MTPTYDLAEQADYLRDDIRNIMSQIQHTPSETNADRFHLISLLFTKYAIVAEAHSIICEANHALHSASNGHLPHSQYLELKSAYVIAREIINLAHSAPPRMIQSLSTNTREDRHNSDFHFEATDVAIDCPKN